MKMLFATTNRGKSAEVAKAAANFGVEILTPEQVRKAAQAAGKDLGPWPEVEETETTYAGNAKRKADAFYAWCRMPVLGDDSGIELDHLAGGPGVYTARYAGPNATDAENRTKMLNEMKGATRRTARYVCHLHLVLDAATFKTERSTIEGTIGVEEQGSGGFGYDPIFIPNGFSETMAQLKERGVVVKTHRIKAVEQLLATLLP